MPDTHHIYGPSTLKNRAVCPGWKNDVHSDKTLADEGTLLHKAAETGETDILHTAEQRDCVAKVLGYTERLESGAIKVFKELRLEILGGKTFGTADRVIYRRKDGKLHVDVVDFKFGRNPVDDAEVNMQGHAYLLGAWDLFPEAETGAVHFLLPRLDIVDCACFSRSADYHRLALPVSLTIDRAEKFAASIDEARGTCDESMLNPTHENCLYCGFKARCPSVIRYALATAKKYAPLEVVEETHSSAITRPADMARIFTASRILDKMVESVRVHAMQMAEANGGVLCDENGKPVYEIVERGGMRKITDVGLALPVLSKYLDDRELLQVADISLTDALKLISGKAKRGEKGKIIGQVEAELAELDAVSSGEPVRYLKKVAS